MNDIGEEIIQEGGYIGKHFFQYKRYGVDEHHATSKDFFNYIRVFHATTAKFPFYGGTYVVSTSAV